MHHAKFCTATQGWSTPEWWNFALYCDDASSPSNKRTTGDVFAQCRCVCGAPAKTQAD
jgi:hypothetical protein